MAYRLILEWCTPRRRPLEDREESAQSAGRITYPFARKLARRWAQQPGVLHVADAAMIYVRHVILSSLELVTRPPKTAKDIH